MSRYFISQPMRDRSEEEIDEERKWIFEIVQKYDPEAELCEKEDCADRTALECLGMSIQRMATADLVIFSPHWYTARGCFLEHACCGEYDRKHLDLPPLDIHTDSGLRLADTEIAHAICDLKGARYVS